MSSIIPTPGAHRTSHDVVVVGCGNLLRGDDGAGPECMRLLTASGLPAGVIAIDAGTSGADVALCMREANRVILVDACQSGRPPGSLLSLSAAELAEIPAAGPLDIHAFRWIDAVRLTSALAGEQPGPQVSVWLVEGGEFAPGSGLSPPVAAAVARLAHDLKAELAAASTAAPGV
jgi:hydrogenase maturation protease